MRTSAKLGLAGLIAALLLSAAVSTASARSLSVSNQNIRVTWSVLEFRGPTATIRCQVTLEGSFASRTIAKVRGTLIGNITRAQVKTESCTNSRRTFEGLPWHITYEGFRGTLPNITELFFLIREMQFNDARMLGTALECRFGTAADNITGTAVLNAAREVTNLIPTSGRSTVSLAEARNEEFFLRCPGSQVLFASATDGIVRLLGSATTRIRVTLI